MYFWKRCRVVLAEMKVLGALGFVMDRIAWNAVLTPPLLRVTVTSFIHVSN